MLAVVVSTGNGNSGCLQASLQMLEVSHTASGSGQVGHGRQSAAAWQMIWWRGSPRGTGGPISSI